jgi:xanthine/CO dehydrogenase XdhC/CoxF family maturation factor
MDRNDYLNGIGELYAAEVLGEALANRWLELATDPGQKYKLCLFLQLESEAKVRLRPLLARYGISLVEDARHRSDGSSAAEQFASQPWKEAMATLAKLAVPYADRFRSLLQAAPPEDVPLIRFMVDHELSVARIAEREAAGEAAMESELVVKLAHPIARRT